MTDIKTADGRVLYSAEANDLRGAVIEAVREGYLRGAYLGDRSDDDPNHPLFATRLDLWAVLDQAPREVGGLRAALTEGQVDGSTYRGECACLVGTIANVRQVDVEEVGLPQMASRPAELWFVPIRKGDTPDSDSEGGFRAATAVRWIDEWSVSRRALCAALGDR